MLLAIALELRRVPHHHPALVGIATLAWLLAVALRSPRCVSLRIAAIITCAVTMTALHLIATLMA